jgi:hypothetical protein
MSSYDITIEKDEDNEYYAKVDWDYKCGRGLYWVYSDGSFHGDDWWMDGGMEYYEGNVSDETCGWLDHALDTLKSFLEEQE